MIGLLVTGNGIPIAHYVFAGNTADSTTLPGVMADYQRRFGVGRIALVADRGLISEHNLEEVTTAGFDHVLATRLHRDPDVAAVLKAVGAAGEDRWRTVPGIDSSACEVAHDGRRFVVVFSAQRQARDDRRREELLTRTETKLIALAERVAAGRLVDAAKIGAAADRILRDSGVGRCFSTTIRAGSFSWDYDAQALHYEEHLLTGRYVLTTSLTVQQASTTDVVRHYRMLQNVERRFRVMKDFLGLRPVHHRTEAARPCPHRALRHRRGHRSGHGRGPGRRRRPGPRPRRSGHDPPPGAGRTGRDPPSPPPGRPAHRAR